jgi:hypothetical protein
MDAGRRRWGKRGANVDIGRALETDCHNPFGVEIFFELFSQGRPRMRPTLGFGTESFQDSANANGGDMRQGRWDDPKIIF